MVKCWGKVNGAMKRFSNYSPIFMMTVLIGDKRVKHYISNE